MQSDNADSDRSRTNSSVWRGNRTYLQQNIKCRKFGCNSIACRRRTSSVTSRVKQLRSENEEDGKINKEKIVQEETAETGKVSILCNCMKTNCSCAFNLLLPIAQNLGQQEFDLYYFVV